MPQGNNLSLNIQAKEILGVLPGIDRRKVPKPHVVDGKNFLFNVDGPYSGFGRRLVTKDSFHNMVVEHTSSLQSFRTDDDTGYIFTTEAVFAYDTGSMFFYPVYSYDTITENDFGWTECFIAGKHYFCHKNVGVLEYTPDTKEWKLFADGDLVVEPVAICNARGRLVILGRSAYQWSALDDPNDLTASLTTGAGLQSLAILGGNSLKVMSLGDNFLVFTTKGIIIAEFSGGQAVFRHRVITRDFHAINAVCIEQLDTGTIVFIDEKGLFTCAGQLPEVYQPLFSEFLSAQLLKLIKSGNAFRNYRLHLHRPNQLLFVMISLFGTDEHFERAYVLYRPIDQFGTFDSTFHNFIEVPVDVGSEVQYRFTVIEANGAFKEFNNSNYIEQTTLPDDGIFWRTEFDWPANRQDGVYHFPSLLQMSADREWMFVNLATGWYTIGDQIVAREFSTDPQELAPTVGVIIILAGDGEYSIEYSTEFAVGSGEDISILSIVFRSEMVLDTGFTLIGPISVPAELGSLDSEVKIGMFRYAELKYDDELGVVSNLSVYSGETISQEDEDYQDGSIEVVEDYETMPDSTEDWGFGVLSSDLYTVDLTGTNDGFGTFLHEDLINIVEAGSQLNRYSCNVGGQFFIVGIHALAYPEMYRLAALEIAGNSGGRL